jgi:branched-chain amino acid transport system ATP-binding protein
VTRLEASGVQVRYGGVLALDAVDLSLSAGTVTGVIGPNGAGKSTLIDALMGYVPLTRGQVRLDGRDLHEAPPHQRAALGMTRTFQSLELFDDLTVTENLLVAAERAGVGRGTVDDTAARLGLAGKAGVLAAQLSPSDRKALALARALAAEPTVVLLDEPAAGLDRGEREALVSTVRALADSGTAVLLVDHDVAVVMEACEQVVVLDVGRVVAHGESSAIRHDPQLAAAYLGARPERPTPGTTSGDVGDVVLSATDLYAGYGSTPVVRGINLFVQAGEIVALLGPNGAGKTTTLKAISGAVPDRQGRVEVLGSVAGTRPHRLARRGVAHVLQTGQVFATLTVADNLRLADWSGDGMAAALEFFPTLRSLLQTCAGDLSGGEQQLLAFARALASRPRLLLVDELSLGLAPEAVRHLMDVLTDVSEQTGAAVLFAEQHVHHALSIARRAYVLVAGRIVLEDTAVDLAQHPERIAAAYLGESAE